MYNLSYEQLKRRTIVSFVIAVILLGAMVIIFASSGEIEGSFLILFPIIAIVWTLQLLGMLVCWRELWKPFLQCLADAFKSLVGVGAGITGVPVIGFFINFFKSFVILAVLFIKALIIAIKVMVFVLKGKDNAS